MLDAGCGRLCAIPCERSADTRGGGVLAAIVGGKLQGVEAAYLARKAGWERLLLDKRPQPPALPLVDRSVCLDVCCPAALERALKGVDVIVPALENDAALTSLVRHARHSGVPLAFDPAAYAVSSSKKRSDRLFLDNGLPVPPPWPGCPLPVIAKPSGESGSTGVRLFSDETALRTFARRAEGEWVYQAFVEGPSYSVEVVGGPGRYTAFQVTDLEMDRNYDCKRVAAPSGLAPHLKRRFQEMAKDIAALVALKGLMDVEVVQHGDALRILEIDARLPSQTPIVVHASTGVNLLAELVHFCRGDRMEAAAQPVPAPRGVVLEHIHAARGRLAVQGEHIMSRYGPLYLETDFFGADEAVTSRVNGCDAWVATLIFQESDRAAAWAKRQQTIDAIRRRFHLEPVKDESPQGA